MKTLQLSGLPVRYPFKFTEKEKEDIRASCQKGAHSPSEECLRLVVGAKALRTILMVEHGIEPKEVENTLKGVILYKPTVLGIDEVWGRTITVYYIMPRQKTRWEHSFLVINLTSSGQGGLDGELITQNRRRYRRPG